MNLKSLARYIVKSSEQVWDKRFDEEVEVRIQFDTSEMSKKQFEYLQSAQDYLHKAGIRFDSGGTQGQYDWEFDWSLNGPVKVNFRRFKNKKLLEEDKNIKV
jgi:hypothetical protein